jgi:ERCC4-related helicase
MVIIDEAQNVKQRDEEPSNTRQNIELLLERLREKNPKLIVLFLTATPVINNLTEGVKLLEMIANKEFPNLKTSNQVRNASRLYMEYLEYSLRFKIDYKLNIVKETFTSQTYIPTRIGAEQLRDYNYSDWEILCTPDRIPKMIELVRKHGKVIIYTEYVSIVVDQIKNAMEKEGFRVGTFTGQKDGKEGLHKKTDQKGVFTNPFQNGDIDVLIASSPIAEGIDGLQKICNCIIFNGVTWTFARLEQIQGRIIRTGQIKDDVYLYTVMSRIENYDFDQRIKVDRLYQKEMLQMCVLDGYIPNIKQWNKKTKDYYHDFVECVLKDRKSRVATKKQIRDSGVTEA